MKTGNSLVIYFKEFAFYPIWMWPVNPFPLDNKEAFENGGQKIEIGHFRWMVAAVVRTAFPKVYHNKVCFYFHLFFSEIFTVPKDAVFFNSSYKCSLIHMMRDLYDLNPDIFTSHFTLEFYGFQNWWSRIRFVAMKHRCGFGFGCGCGCECGTQYFFKK